MGSEGGAIQHFPASRHPRLSKAASQVKSLRVVVVVGQGGPQGGDGGAWQVTRQGQGGKGNQITITGARGGLLMMAELDGREIRASEI